MSARKMDVPATPDLSKCQRSQRGRQSRRERRERTKGLSLVLFLLRVVGVRGVERPSENGGSRDDDSVGSNEGVVDAHHRRFEVEVEPLPPWRTLGDLGLEAAVPKAVLLPDDEESLVDGEISEALEGELAPNENAESYGIANCPEKKAATHGNNTRTD